MVHPWIFGVSTGHAATQTFSSGDCYEDRQQPNTVWQFEVGHRYGDSRGWHEEQGIKAWYAALRDMTADERNEHALRLVNAVLLPDMILSAPTAWQGSSPIVDLGHHINLGLLDPLATALKHQVRFVRVIRSRFDTVRSFLAEQKAPCSAGMWTLCPTQHPDIALPVQNATWERLSQAQRNFWFIDEVEARWQRLLSRHPALPRLTVRWCSKPQLLQAHQRIADFIGHGSLTPKNCSFHKHSSKTAQDMSDAELAAEDRGYRKLVKYSSATWKRIKDVQHPQDCSQG